jgi:hypothetical protein
MPFRVETRFQLERWRDLAPFLREALALVADFRRSTGAQAMWLKGKLWRLEFGSYSEWRDEPSMRRFVAGSGHRRAMRRSHGEWPGESWTLYDGGRPVYYQRCLCGASLRGPGRQAACQRCGRPFPARVDAAPGRPMRGVPISPRIRAGRAVRREVLGPVDSPACERCGHRNEPGTVYCLRCGARTYRAMNFVSRFGWTALATAVAFFVLSCIVIGLYFASRSWV